MVDNFHDILLVHHDAEGFAQVLFEDGVQVAERRRIVKALDVFPHHA